MFTIHKFKATYITFLEGLAESYTGDMTSAKKFVEDLNLELTHEEISKTIIDYLFEKSDSIDTSYACRVILAVYSRKDYTYDFVHQLMPFLVLHIFEKFNPIVQWGVLKDTVFELYESRELHIVRCRDGGMVCTDPYRPLKCFLNFKPDDFNRLCPNLPLLVVNLPNIFDVKEYNNPYSYVFSDSTEWDTTDDESEDENS